MAEPFFESVGPVLPAVEPRREKSTPVAEPFFEAVGPVIEQAPEVVPAVAPQEPGLDGYEPVTEFAEASTTTPRSVENEILEVPEEPVLLPKRPTNFPSIQGKKLWSLTSNLARSSPAGPSMRGPVRKPQRS